MREISLGQFLLVAVVLMGLVAGVKSCVTGDPIVKTSVGTRK